MAAWAPSVTAQWQPASAAPEAAAPTPTAGVAATMRPFRYGVDEQDRRDPPLGEGEIVGDRYRVVRLLGEGGMGRVYEAEHVALGQHVAVKLLRSDRRNAEHLARFRQEAEAAGRIGHPAIVGVSDFGGRDERHAYMVMELLRGESLESWLSRPGTLRAGLEAIAGVARGLHAAHHAGVVHRDLKPANLFLHHGGDGRPQPKILDFGIAKLASTEHTAIATAAGTVLGTPYYIAPERALGRALDARADLYSLGVILYEIVTGTVPFVDETFMGVLAKHVRVMPLDPRQAAPDRGVPDGLARLIMSLLAKDPAGRPDSAEAVALELERLLVDEREAIDAARTGPRESSGDAVATVHIDEIAERPTCVPGARESQDTVVQALLAAVPTAVDEASAVVRTSTRALGSNAMRDGLPRAGEAQRGSSGWLIAGAMIVVGGLAGWWIAARGTQPETAAVVLSPARPEPVREATRVVDAPAAAPPERIETLEIVKPSRPLPEPPELASPQRASKPSARTRKPKSKPAPTATTPSAPTPATPAPSASTLPPLKD